MNEGNNGKGEWIASSLDNFSGNIHDVRMKSSDNTGMLVDVDIQGIYTINITVNGIDFQIIEMLYARYASAVGKPKLPVIRRYLEAPRGVVLSVEIIYSDYKILDGYFV